MVVYEHYCQVAFKEYKKHFLMYSDGVSKTVSYCYQKASREFLRLHLFHDFWFEKLLYSRSVPMGLLDVIYMSSETGPSCFASHRRSLLRFVKGTNYYSYWSNVWIPYSPASTREWDQGFVFVGILFPYHVKVLLHPFHQRLPPTKLTKGAAGTSLENSVKKT